MTSKEFNLRLIEALPEIKDRYDEEVEWQEGDDTGSHVVFGDVLTPYLLENIKAKNINIVKMVFDFLEEMLKTNDVYASEVITCSVLESIVTEDIDMVFVECLLGDTAKEIWANLRDSLYSKRT